MQMRLVADERLPVPEFLYLPLKCFKSDRLDNISQEVERSSAAAP